LPRQLTAFIGRAQEITACAALLHQPDVALLTLSGPGGVGKSRLALEVTAAVLSDFPDGGWLVDLAPLGDPGLVVPTIAGVLGVTEQGQTSLLETLMAFLQPKRLLLVLDNFEHVLAAASAVTALLQAAPGVKVLATSRVVLGLYGEQEYIVPPLALPDPQHLPDLAELTQYEAVQLFIERGRAVRADFTVTPATAPAVAGICARLDGLPLAIELAAVRLRLFPPEALLRRLDQRLQILTGGARDRLARHQTLQATLEWSYQLLGAGEQQLLARLAVFLGSRTLEALEAVCNHDGALGVDVLTGVEVLVSHNLLRQEEGSEGEPRFWLLETIHEFAREKLATRGETIALRDAHLAYYTQWAEAAEAGLKGAEQQVWLAWLEEEHDNLRAGLGWARERAMGNSVAATQGLRLAAALDRFWDLRGYWSEGREWLVGLLAVGGMADPATYIRAQNVAGSLAWRQGDYAAARALLEEALTHGRALGDREGVATALFNLGVVALYQGDQATAQTLLEESLALQRALGERRGMAIILSALGAVAMSRGDAVTADTLYNEGLALYRELGDHWNTGVALLNLGTVAEVRGDYATAWTCYEESLARCRELGDRDGIALGLFNLGEVAYLQGEYAAAQSNYAKSLTIYRELGNRREILHVLQSLGGVMVAQAGDHAMRLTRATRVLGAATALLTEMGTVLSPVERIPYERAVTAARAELGEGAFTVAWAAGQQLSLEQAIALARELADE
jgi:predicted ATPase/Tfp pilus assembly protein PilF